MGTGNGAAVSGEGNPIRPVTPADYEAVVDAWTSNEVQRTQWRELRDALDGRGDWYFQDPREEGYIGGPLWGFGLEGAAQLVLSVTDASMFLLYRSGEDREVMADYNLGPVLEWLDQHEHEFEGFTPLQEQLIELLHEREVQRWREDAAGGQEPPPTS